MDARLGNHFLWVAFGIAVAGLALVAIMTVLAVSTAPVWILFFLGSLLFAVLGGRAVLHFFEEP
jgi:hypothetical protein